MKVWTKKEVLGRDELTIDDIPGIKGLEIQGEYPHNQFWEGEKCYMPVKYRAMIFKARVRIKGRV